MLREAYRRLTGDASAATNLSEAEVDERIRQMIDQEDPDLIWDLRLNNSGRPEEYHDFLVKCQEFVANKLETAVDDRRHDPVDEEGYSLSNGNKCERPIQSSMLLQSVMRRRYHQCSGYDYNFGRGELQQQLVEIPVELK